MSALHKSDDDRAAEAAHAKMRELFTSITRADWVLMDGRRVRTPARWEPGVGLTATWEGEEVQVRRVEYFADDVDGCIAYTHHQSGITVVAGMQAIAPFSGRASRV